MCGIVGLFLKDDSLSPRLGGMLSDMLVTMTDRGPDSAGIAVYGAETSGGFKVTVQAEDPETAFAGLAEHLSAATGQPCSLAAKSTHAVISTAPDNAAALISHLRESHAGLRIMSTGEAMEIYKEVGLPRDVSARFEVSAMGGTHGIGHTRMATESAVTTMGAHPFSTGADQCLVHNGSLSNHNSLRRKLRREGVRIETENDTEVAAAYLTYRMQQGRNLGQALEDSLDDLDGFFTFVVGTKNGFGVLRDPIACKPAVMAETDAYVAFGSEYRALVSLPGIDTARVWEPEPANVYFWER
ncbi:MAG: glutamine amidotransferase family protein [Pseudomonadota bacterium]|nr:glutamine amidotransferase family protein [Pseudomonadota bacterium]MEC8274543.1 glutamine amidotransferase family protein [Pseudomonadota bacterium]